MDPAKPGRDADVEAPKDPGALKPNLTDKEIQGHHNVYVGVNVPGQSSRRSGHGHHHRHGRHRHHRGRHIKGAPGQDPNRPGADDKSAAKSDSPPVTPPAQRVQFILGEDHDDSGHEPHPLFSEMEELVFDEDGEMEWKETARWVKFEEDVEEGGNRWSKPHVATLSLHSLFELRSMLLNGTVCLDMAAHNLDDITELVLDNMINTNQITYDKKAIVKDAILKRHRHQYEGQPHHHKKHGEGEHQSAASNLSKLPLIRSLADIGRNHSSSKSMARVKEFFGSKENLHKSDSGSSLSKKTSSPSLSPTKGAATLADAKGFLAVPAQTEPNLDPTKMKRGQMKRLSLPGLFWSPAAMGDVKLSRSSTCLDSAGSEKPAGEAIAEKPDEEAIAEKPAAEEATAEKPAEASPAEASPAEKPADGGTPGGMHESDTKETNKDTKASDMNEMGHNGSDSAADFRKMNAHFMKKLPKGSEASNILVGELNTLDKPLSAFIRLSEAVNLGDLTEVPVPTRFIYILLGPAGENNINVGRYHEIGRAVATIMADEVFHDVAYKAKKREHLLAGIDEFLDAVTVLPPGEWDPSIRIEPPQQVPSQEGRKHAGMPSKPPPTEDDHEEEERKLREESGLVRTGRLFGGLINDIKRKKPFYLSDFKDALAVQSIASYIFIYFACLTPIITFGGMLGDATGDNIAAIESLVSGFLVGVTYGFFSGQPLTILGSTGPILVFETIMYDLCKGQQWDYLSLRFWVGLWVGLLLLILVATDASAFVCYITRFTEENFATLIAFIFIKKAVEKLIHIEDDFPIEVEKCFCKPNETLAELWGVTNSSPIFDKIEHDDNDGKKLKHANHFECEFTVNVDGMEQTMTGMACNYVPNAFLMSTLLFIGTFLISWNLKKFKAAPFFPSKVRSVISDFAVIIAIVSMTLFDFGVGVKTPKLSVPEKLTTTIKGRGWLVNPMKNIPFWVPVAAVVPAILGTILIFMDQQITAVIVNRKEHKLIKGGGYHLDLLIVTVLIVICSIFGLPWFVAATVLSINHVKSLTRESETAAPGEKPQFLGIREQRVTHILIFFTIGLSVLMVPLLKLIPMPVLYGVFLYMGVASLNGLQFFDRILLFFMPQKYQPDYPYLRRVPLRRVHLFTLVQLACLILLWIIKDIKATSILFPIMLVVMMGVRKVLDFFFDKKELKILDDILPEFKRHEKLDQEDKHNQGEGGGGGSGDYDDEEKRRTSLRYTSSSIEVPMYNGNVMKIPIGESSDINISEEMNKSGVWKSLEGSSASLENKNGKATTTATSGKPTTKKRMSIVTEDEEDQGIQIKIDKPKSKAETGTSEEKAQLVAGGKDGETPV